MASALPKPAECCNTCCALTVIAVTGGALHHGDGDPNGVVAGSPPDQYTDDLTGQQWSKTSGNNTTTGWV